jgi:hypothetical protein
MSLAELKSQLAELLYEKARRPNEVAMSPVSSAVAVSSPLSYSRNVDVTQSHTAMEYLLASSKSRQSDKDPSADVSVSSHTPSQSRKPSRRSTLLSSPDSSEPKPPPYLAATSSPVTFKSTPQRRLFQSEKSDGHEDGHGESHTSGFFHEMPGKALSKLPSPRGVGDKRVATELKASATFVFANDEEGRKKAMEAAHNAAAVRGSVGFMCYLDTDPNDALQTSSSSSHELVMDSFGLIRVSSDGHALKSSVLSWLTNLFSSNHPKWKVIISSSFLLDIFCVRWWLAHSFIL